MSKCTKLNIFVVEEESIKLYRIKKKNFFSYSVKALIVDKWCLNGDYIF